MMTVSEFLEDGGYADLDAWMADSDYVRRDGEWYERDETGRRWPVDPLEQVTAAMESAGAKRGTALSRLVERRYAMHARNLTPEERRTLADAVKLLERLPIKKDGAR